MAKKKDDDNHKLIAENRKARFAYAIGDTLEAGKLKQPPDVIAQLKKIEDESHTGKMMRALLFNGRRPGA